MNADDLTGEWQRARCADADGQPRYCLVRRPPQHMPGVHVSWQLIPGRVTTLNEQFLEELTLVPLAKPPGGAETLQGDPTPEDAARAAFIAAGGRVVPPQRTLAQIAYEAYWELPLRAVSGHDILDAWARTGPSVKAAWARAAQAVIEEYQAWPPPEPGI